MSNFPISSLRSVELVVPDLKKAVEFYTQVWGLLEVRSSMQTCFLRGSGVDPYILSLTQGHKTAVHSCTFRAAPNARPKAIKNAIVAAGGLIENDLNPASAPGGGQRLEFIDLSGRRIAIVFGDQRAAPISENKSMPVRLAHVNINCSDLQKDTDFFIGGLGFQLTDRSKMMAFLRTNSDHHAVVLADANTDNLNHVSFLHKDVNRMMLAGGNMCDAGFKIGWGPGRHGPGDNVFLYFVDPFGIVIEHTADVLQVDDSYKVGAPSDWVWPKGRTDQWGIAPEKTKQCKEAQLAIPFAASDQV